MMGMTGQQLGGLPPPSHQQQQQAAAVAQQQAAAVAQHQAAVSSASVSSSFLAQAHAQLAALKSQVNSTCTYTVLPNVSFGPDFVPSVQGTQNFVSKPSIGFVYIENESMQFCVDQDLFYFL
jgi:hypothetical protein